LQLNELRFAVRSPVGGPREDEHQAIRAHQRIPGPHLSILILQPEIGDPLADLRTELNATLRPDLSELASGFIRDLTGGRYTDLELDEESHEVWRAGRRIQLSPTEFKLLRYLMTNVGRVLSKGQILDYVWNYDFQGDSSIVESYVSYLRRKVDAVEPRLIHTIRSVGYVLRLPDA